MAWRKKKARHINYTPTLTIRKPVNGQTDTDRIILGQDELEALRLKNLNDLGIIKAAQQMKISKSLFAKIHNEAIEKVTTALVYGKQLHIETGSELPPREFQEPIL